MPVTEDVFEDPGRLRVATGSRNPSGLLQHIFYILDTELSDHKVRLQYCSLVRYEMSANLQGCKNEDESYFL